MDVDKYTIMIEITVHCSMERITSSDCPMLIRTNKSETEKTIFVITIEISK